MHTQVLKPVKSLNEISTVDKGIRIGQEFLTMPILLNIEQGSLSDGKGSVKTVTLYFTRLDQVYFILKILFTLLRNKEVNGT
jgi:hypothetical protein